MSPTFAVGFGSAKSTTIAPTRLITGTEVEFGVMSLAGLPSFTKKWKKVPSGTVVISGPSIAIASPPSIPAESIVMCATWPPALSVSRSVISAVVVIETAWLACPSAEASISWLETETIR
ncbi:MAG: hypothetical protein V9E87_08990 [Gemmatimonadales bacterium]